MGNIIQFPQRKQPANINWHELETESLQAFPKIPKTAVQLLKKVLTDPHGLKNPNAYAAVYGPGPGAGYPQGPIPFFGTKSGVLWLLDLFDRLGGEIVHGTDKHVIKRAKKRYPVFQLFETSEASYKGWLRTLGDEYEHFLYSETWQFLGKDLLGVDLMVALVAQLKGGERYFVVLVDKTTILLLFDCAREGFRIEDFLALGGISVNFSWVNPRLCRGTPRV